MAAINTGLSGQNYHDMTATEVRQSQREARTAVLVLVQSVEAGSPPRVSVLPLVGQVTPDGRVIDHLAVYDIPTTRLQNGHSAIILDPTVGDIGLMVCCDRDITAAKESLSQCPPGSQRIKSLSDGVYIATCLADGPPPAQVIALTSSGITINSPTSVSINSPQLLHNGVNVGSDHKHSGVTTGSGITGNPVP